MAGWLYWTALLVGNTHLLCTWICLPCLPITSAGCGSLPGGVTQTFIAEVCRPSSPSWIGLLPFSIDFSCRTREYWGTLRGFPVLRTYYSLPPLCSRSTISPWQSGSITAANTVSPSDIADFWNALHTVNAFCTACFLPVNSFHSKRNSVMGSSSWNSLVLSWPPFSLSGHLVEWWNGLLKTQLQFKLGGRTLGGWGKVLQEVAYAPSQHRLHSAVSPIARIHRSSN